MFSCSCVAQSANQSTPKPEWKWQQSHSGSAKHKHSESRFPKFVINLPVWKVFWHSHRRGLRWRAMPGLSMVFQRFWNDEAALMTQIACHQREMRTKNGLYGLLLNFNWTFYARNGETSRQRYTIELKRLAISFMHEFASIKTMLFNRIFFDTLALPCSHTPVRQIRKKQIRMIYTRMVESICNGLNGKKDALTLKKGGFNIWLFR